ncbi:hypothetical protein ACFQZC_10705 [Streptacidiphilus monticola]
MPAGGGTGAPRAHRREPLNLVADLDTAALWFSSRLHARRQALTAVGTGPLPPAKPPVAACGYRRHGAVDLKPLRPHPMKRRHLR